jgi:hypothetical protein
MRIQNHLEIGGAGPIEAAAHPPAELVLGDLPAPELIMGVDPEHVRNPLQRGGRDFLGFAGVLDSIVAAHHVLEMFRRTLPDNHVRKHLGRLSNRLTKILAETRKLATEEIGR